jgi:DNA-binding response OmpR family regulator
VYNVKIAVVDQDELTRDFVANVMTYSVNREVDSFENSEAFKAYIEAGAMVDLVLSDVQLSGESGFELLQFLKDAQPQIKFITMSASPKDENRSSELGADAFLAKPFALQDLFDIVKQFVVGE